MRRAASLLLAVPALMSVLGPPPAWPAPPAPPMFLVIMVDGLRPDRLGCFGYQGYTSPLLDRLCRSGIAFTRAYAQSASGPASMASLLTSRPPAELAGAGGDHRVGERPTFASALQAAGFVTIGYAPDGDAGRGFERGFREFNRVRPAPPIAGEGPPPGNFDRAILPLVVWMERHRWDVRWNKLLLFFRYDAVTLGNLPSADFLRRFAPIPFDLAGSIGLRNRLAAGETTFTGDQKRAIGSAYDASIAELDAGLESVLERLTEPGLAARLWIVLVAPFSTSLGEHGIVGSASSLYEEQIRVPLVIVPPPGHPSGHHVQGLVRLLDVGPTLLDLAGLPPEPAFAGRSLRQSLEGPSRHDLEAVAELPVSGVPRRHARAVITPALQKRIERPDGSVEEYELGLDPLETRDLAQPEAQSP